MIISQHCGQDVPKQRLEVVTVAVFVVVYSFTNHTLFQRLLRAVRTAAGGVQRLTS